MERIIRSITGIIAAVCMGQSLLRMFSSRPERLKRGILYLLVGTTIVLPSWVGDKNPIMLFPFFILGFVLLLSGNKLQKLVIGGIFYTLLIPVNMLIDSHHWSDAMQLLTTACKTLVWCALALFLFRIVPKGGLRLSKRLWLLLGGLTLAPLMTMLSFSIWANTFQIDSEYKLYASILRQLSYTILPFVIISGFTLLIAAVVLSRHEALEHENKLTALREVYYAGLKQEQTGLRTLRHDLRNHVTALQGLAGQGKQETLTRYLADLADSPALAGSKQYTKNEIANVVLCSKAAQMETLGLVPDFVVSLPETLAFPDIELCALLGNSLDNAIEGIAGAEKKTILLRAQLEKGVFMLQVQNAIGSKVNSDLSTTKADADRHGYGIAGMKDIALRHGGSLEAGARDGYFELLICFPCRE